MALRSGFLREVFAMALDTLRQNKLRSGLTVLGIVIGITAIVGVTSLIRGFDQALQTDIQAMGPRTIFLARFSGVSFAAGKQLSELMKRPNLTVDDARAIDRSSPSIALVDVWLGAAGPPAQARITYEGKDSKMLGILGVTENYASVNFLALEAGRLFTTGEVEHRKTVIVIGEGPRQSLFPNVDPIGKTVRMAGVPYTVIGIFAKRKNFGAFNLGQDEFAIIPYTSYQKQFGTRAQRAFRGEHRSILIAMLPREDVSRDQAVAEVVEIMRVRHGLKLDEPNDFDILTQDAVLDVWNQFTQATFLALVAISSIALMVGGIGVMAIMMISVTERTHEIGLRKAIGARRREILWQFLLEAVVLTSIGGVLGILLGSTIGLTVHFAFEFPISLPWWSFALGIGFSAAVGIAFGMFPAIKAARLDPIVALHYE